MDRLAALVLLCAALLLAGCGDDDEGAATATPTGTPTEAATETPTETPTPAGAATGAVKIQNFAFDPKEVTVKAGENVAWSNEDPAAHTVTAKSGAKFDSGTIAGGSSFEWKAEGTGTVEYFCEIHPSMTGTIEVE